MFKRCIFGAVALSASLSVAGFANAADYPGISTRIQVTNLSQTECDTRAEAALRSQGFAPPQGMAPNGMGVQQNFSASIECKAEKNMVFVVVASTPGAPPGRAGAMADALAQSFGR